eukprot:CAMPEP_0196764074 /NCGR_PEP_ID=MMETSP1095-20130614/5326_1 /TAXON_ID=96789 ORGANISM="Chromulina nebulosa, Strain UTEXLB2642" /NCGR_SAMPLE_ID=MMETSP1095 /ASSEMBLY_ACC=CAM_ASM_000446 /LENGTH=395 /DNA_ID=CAMNT_0042118681 /DNA_START=377 /DNA_END=1564 /DNA_ORIENTATION=-
MISLLGNDWYEPILQEIINKFLDYQWDNYLSVQVPDEYIEEINGLTAGGIAQGLTKNNIGKLITRGIVLANFPGDIPNINLIIIDEINNPTINQLDDKLVDQVVEKLKSSWSGLTCSMYGVWGSRTENNRLFTGRNLDWLKSTGISMYKLVTIYHPSNGYSHATIGWAGVWGALTGMSSQGLTVHEANLESNDVTFRGFPWVLRLRYIMTYASTLTEALQLWSSTNNTEGYNHGIGSAYDNKAVVLETMASNTAIFYDNDERELALGSPREEAVYRTNHGYDDYTIFHYMWNDTNAYQNSLKRYNAFPEAFDSYESSKQTITYVEAVNITAILGSKGENLYQCSSPYTAGSNVLSVTFDPSNLIAYSAWENGLGNDLWTPAACNTYIKIDFNEWM